MGCEHAKVGERRDWPVEEHDTEAGVDDVETLMRQERRCVGDFEGDPPAMLVSSGVLDHRGAQVDTEYLACPASREFVGGGAGSTADVEH
jgi:hypothetical protein